MSAGQAASNRVQRDSEAAIRSTTRDAKARYMAVISQRYAGQPLPIILEFLQAAYQHDLAAIQADHTIGQHLRENVRLANVPRVQNRAHRIQGIKELQKEGTRLAAYEIYEEFLQEDRRLRAASDKAQHDLEAASTKVASEFAKMIKAHEAELSAKKVAQQFARIMDDYAASRAAAAAAAVAADAPAAAPHAGGARRTKRKSSKVKKSRKHK